MIPSVGIAPSVPAKRRAPRFSQSSRLNPQASVSYFQHAALSQGKPRPSVFALARSRCSRPLWPARRPMRYQAAYANAKPEWRSFALPVQLFRNRGRS